MPSVPFQLRLYHPKIHRSHHPGGSFVSGAPTVGSVSPRSLSKHNLWSSPEELQEAGLGAAWYLHASEAVIPDTLVSLWRSMHRS